MLDKNALLLIKNRLSLLNTDSPEQKNLKNALLTIISKEDCDAELIIFLAKHGTNDEMKDALFSLFAQLQSQQREQFKRRGDLKLAWQQIKDYQDTKDPIYLLGLPIDSAAPCDQKLNLITIFKKLVAQEQILSLDEFKLPELTMSDFPRYLNLTKSDDSIDKIKAKIEARRGFNPVTSTNTVVYAVELRKACQQGNTEAVKILLSTYSGHILQDVLSHGPDALLVQACDSGHSEIVKLLLASYAKKTKSNSLKTLVSDALIIACDKDQSDLILQLLSSNYYNSLYDCLTGFDHRTLRFACKYGKVDVLKLLLNFYSKEDLLTVLTARGNDMIFNPLESKNIEVLKLLLLVCCQEAKNINFKKGKAHVLEQLHDYLENDLLQDVDIDFDSQAFLTALDWVFDQLPETKAANTLAPIVLVGDGYLRFFTSSRVLTAQELKTQSFFKIALQLPLELQMILCNTLFGLSRSLIFGAETEDALKNTVNQFYK